MRVVAPRSQQRSRQARMSASAAPLGHVDHDQLERMLALVNELAARPHHGVEHSLTRQPQPGRIDTGISLVADRCLVLASTRT
jgi:hypothetical protein